MSNADRALELLLANAVSTGIMHADTNDTDPFITENYAGDEAGYPLVYVRHLPTDRRFVITIQPIAKGLDDGR